MFGLLKVAKYAVYCALACVIYKAIEKCICKLCCTKRDAWLITEETLGTEVGAGHVYKQDGVLGFWTERYMVIKNGKVYLYTDQTRTTVKAEYVLAGAGAERCTAHADEEHKYYFNMVHPDQGTREFYVISEPRRSQWMDLISAQGRALLPTAIMGVLGKVGGFSKTTWEERWCYCAGPTFEYYANKTDELPSGTLWLLGANVRDSSSRGQKYCVEIMQDPSAKESRKGKKKYVFSMETEGEQTKWLRALEGRTVPREAAAAAADGTVSNPLQAGAGTGAGDDANLPERPLSKSKRGYLEKKGKRLGGYTKRFFLLEPKEGAKESEIKLLYYENEEQCKKNGDMKGFVMMLDLGKLPRREGSLDLSFTSKGKAYVLRANSPQERDEWVAHLTAWHEYAVALKKAKAEAGAGGAGGGGRVAGGSPAKGGD